MSDAFTQATGRGLEDDAGSNQRRYKAFQLELMRPYFGTSLLEVGAGLGEFAAQVTGLERHVVTDVDAGAVAAMATRFADRPAVEARVLDLDKDDGLTLGEQVGEPVATVLAINVLEHIEDDAEALRRMAAALRPGGWLVVEDFDVSIQPRACPDAATEDEDRANRIRAGFVELLLAAGVDPVLGRTLRKRLLALGLADGGAEAYYPHAVPATRRLERANTLQVRNGLVSLGLGDDVDRHLEALAAGRVEIATPPLVTAWGRRRA